MRNALSRSNLGMLLQAPRADDTAAREGQAGSSEQVRTAAAAVAITFVRRRVRGAGLSFGIAPLSQVQMEAVAGPSAAATEPARRSREQVC